MRTAAIGRQAWPWVDCSGELNVAEKRIIIIAGPNGAGKTTFAREYLPLEVGITAFINADLIAAGLSPQICSWVGQFRAGVPGLPWMPGN